MRVPYATLTTDGLVCEVTTTLTQGTYGREWRVRLYDLLRGRTAHLSCSYTSPHLVASEVARCTGVWPTMEEIL